MDVLDWLRDEVFLVEQVVDAAAPRLAVEEIHRPHDLTLFIEEGGSLAELFPARVTARKVRDALAPWLRPSVPAQETAPCGRNTVSATSEAGAAGARAAFGAALDAAPPRSPLKQSRERRRNPRRPRSPAPPAAPSLPLPQGAAPFSFTAAPPFSSAFPSPFRTAEAPAVFSFGAAPAAPSPDPSHVIEAPAAPAAATVAAAAAAADDTAVAAVRACVAAVRASSQPGLAAAALAVQRAWRRRARPDSEAPLLPKWLLGEPPVAAALRIQAAWRGYWTRWLDPSYAVGAVIFPERLDHLTRYHPPSPAFSRAATRIQAAARGRATRTLIVDLTTLYGMRRLHSEGARLVNANLRAQGAGQRFPLIGSINELHFLCRVSGGKGLDYVACHRKTGIPLSVPEVLGCFTPLEQTNPFAPARYYRPTPPKSCPAPVSGRCAEEREDCRTSRPADAQPSPGQRSGKRAGARRGATKAAASAARANWQAVMRRRQGITVARGGALYWHGAHVAREAGEAQGEAADCGDDPGLATDDETYGDGLDPAVLSDHDGDDDLPSGVAGA